MQPEHKQAHNKNKLFLKYSDELGLSASKMTFKTIKFRPRDRIESRNGPQVCCYQTLINATQWQQRERPLQSILLHCFACLSVFKVGSAWNFSEKNTQTHQIN